MKEQLSFAEVAPVVRGDRGRFQSKPLTASQKGEIATIERSSYGIFSLFGNMEYPLQSSIITNRSNGQGLKFYQHMMKVDADLSALFALIFDCVLHNPAVWRPASDRQDHLTHARFLHSAFSRIEHLQNALRHMLLAYAYGFTVLEKEYEILESGEFAGAKVWKRLRDKPSHWFTFDGDRNLRFRTSKNYSPGVALNQSKFIVTIFGTNSDPYGDPVLDYCYYPYICRHKGLKDQAIYMDKWASPTVKVEYEGDLEARRQALTVAQAIQGDQSIAIPKGMLLSLLESARNGSVSYENYQAQLFAMISRRVTGQTLATTGENGGSYALAGFHAEGKANKVEMLASFLDSWVSREARELIDENYGPQDAYPRRETLARDLSFKEAHLKIEAAMLANGHRVSLSQSDNVLQNVLPNGPEDETKLAKAGQQVFVGNENWRPVATINEDGEVVPISPEIAPTPAPPKPLPPVQRSLAASVQFAAPPPEIASKAMQIRAHLDNAATEASEKAKPAILKVVKSIAARIRGRKTARSVTKGYLLRAIKGYDASGLGPVFDGMNASAARVHLAAGVDSLASDAAKVALALMMLSIVEAIARRAEEAPEEMSAADFADSLLDENAADSLVEAQAGIFGAVHPTNIASIATGELRKQLNDPAFREANPYVMIVITNPNARLSHMVLDGYIMPSAEAAVSDLLPPFDFGCDCIAVPITKEQALAMGLTGAHPRGLLDGFLRKKGVRPTQGTTPGFVRYTTPAGDTFTPGQTQGFQSAYSGTDMQTQLAALRDKAAQLQNEDPDAFAGMVLWLAILFPGYNILRRDPPTEEINA